MRSCGLCGKLRDDSPHLCMAEVVELLNGAFADAPSADEAPPERTAIHGLLSFSAMTGSGPSSARA